MSHSDLFYFYGATAQIVLRKEIWSRVVFYYALALKHFLMCGAAAQVGPRPPLLRFLDRT
jgi:hypothetical protein